jgi:putative glutamine amidotransferase
MSRPHVAVAAMRSRQVDGLRYGGYVASENVVDAVYRAGGEPVILPPVIAGQRRSLDGFHAVVLPGGRDVDPALYEGTARMHRAPGEFDTVHDTVDLQLARDVVAAAIPTLAICRGMQVLNVALGGTLCPDLPATDVEHGHGVHPVTLEPQCFVARVMDTEHPSVSTCHHQAVDRLGDGLYVTGVADDGVIEAVQHRHAPILAVQWHPEDDAAVAAAEQALFDALVDRARWTHPNAMTGATA